MATSRPNLGRLTKQADATAEKAEALLQSAIRAIRGEMALLAKELNLGGSARDRKRAEEEIKKRMDALAKELNALLAANNQRAAKYAAADASDITGVKVAYSAKRAEAICALVTPAQGENLAAVLTDKMSRNLINALREATVQAMRSQALTGGTLKAMGKDILARWNRTAQEKPVFTDVSGRTWDTGRYIQMNARTNAMRVYNDCLADDISQTGDDLVMVSKGGSASCDGCAPWEGIILSLSGKTKGFPTYEQARQSGCFHPNCTHTLDAVDETADADEIARQRKHPVTGGDNAPIDFDAADERRYEIDTDRKMAEEGCTREEAELLVDRDNLANNIRQGLIRSDADALVAAMTDEQVRALVKDGNPPEFTPTKRVKGGTRKNPKYEAEKWNHGKRGGVVHISREATLDDILKVCKVNEPKKVEPTPQPTPTPIPAPAPKAKAKDETEQNLDRIFAHYNGNDEEKFRQAFRDFPEVYRKKMLAAIDNITESNSTGSTYEQDGSICVSIDEWGRTKDTFAHESGHAILDRLLSSGKFDGYESNKLLKMAKGEIEKWAKGCLGDDWKNILAGAKHWESDRAMVFEQMGVKADLDDNLEAKSLRAGIIDAMGAAFGGKILWGHSISYYSQRWNLKPHELCANITTALCIDDKIPPYKDGYESRTMLEIMNEIMPQTIKWVKKNLFDVD
jgi:hypothetical protein